LNPVGSTYKVLAPTSMSTRPYVEICFATPDGVSKCQLTLASPGSTVNVGLTPVRFTLLGLLQGDITIFGDNKFIVSSDGSNAWYGPASLASLPVSGGIGDIQSGSESGLLNPTTSSFLFSTNQVQMLPAQDYCSYNVQASGIRQLNFLPRLPVTIGTTSWNLNGNSAINGISSNPGPVLGQITMGSYTFRSVINEICPQGNSIGISGCYLCEGGARWTIKAKSSCAPGSCVLTTQSNGVTLLTSSIILERSIETYFINFTMTDKKGTLNLKCSSGGRSFTLEEKYVLEEPRTIIDPNGTIVGYVPGYPNPTIGVDSLVKSLDIGETIGASIGTAVLVAAVLLLVILMIGGLYKCISNKSYERINETYYKNQRSDNDDTHVEMRSQKEDDIDSISDSTDLSDGL